MRDRVLLQSGKGIGGIFRFLARMILPAVRKVAPAVKAIAKSSSVRRGLKQIKRKAISSAMGSVVDLASGKNPNKRLKKDMSDVAEIAKTAILDRNKMPKKKKRKTPVFRAKVRKSIFEG